MKRLAIFSHFDCDDLIDDYVIFYISQLRKVVSDIVFVSTSNLAVAEKQKIEPYCAKVICRSNVGYDFMSYKCGLSDYHASIERYDEVILCNDSVYGPFFELDSLFSRMEIEECDFWGITKNREIAEHIQSYFIVFKRRVVISSAFMCFISSIDLLDSKEEVIRQYEIGLTQYLSKKGFEYKVAFSDRLKLIERFEMIIKYLSSKQIVLNSEYCHFIALVRSRIRLGRTFLKYMLRTPNPSHFLWETYLTTLKNPFIKIELLRKNPLGMQSKEHIIETIKNHTEYPCDMIIEHLNRTKNRY